MLHGTHMCNCTCVQVPKRHEQQVRRTRGSKSIRMVDSSFEALRALLRVTGSTWPLLSRIVSFCLLLGCNGLGSELGGSLFSRMRSLASSCSGFWYYTAHLHRWPHLYRQSGTDSSGLELPAGGFDTCCRQHAVKVWALRSHWHSWKDVLQPWCIWVVLT